jgi:hypothetical protein
LARRAAARFGCSSCCLNPTIAKTWRLCIIRIWLANNWIRNHQNISNSPLLLSYRPFIKVVYIYEIWLFNLNGWKAPSFA